MTAAKRSDHLFAAGASAPRNYRHNLHRPDGKFARKREWIDPQQLALKQDRGIPTLRDVATPPPGQKFVVLARPGLLERIIRWWMWRH